MTESAQTTRHAATGQAATRLATAPNAVAAVVGRRTGWHDADMTETRGVSDLIDHPLPELTFPSTHGDFALRAHVGVRPMVLFFYVRNATAT